MSTNSGIFESFPNPPQNRQDSPFSVAPDAEPAAASPFSVAARQDSPFSVLDDDSDPKVDDFGKPVKLSERRKTDSPFQLAEPLEGFGFEAPAKTPFTNPFETLPAEEAAASSLFSPPAVSALESPLAAEPQRSVSPSTQAAIAAFTEWQEPVAPAVTSPQAGVPAQIPSAFASPAQMAATLPQETQAPAAKPQWQTPASDSQSDSFNIRQLELRAIFGVDREMSADEILQRARALPGMRNVARISSEDMATLEAVKNLLPGLGFGSGPLKLYAGSVPLEFIREGSVMLAVQTDGGFAPGVRETLMIVARELGRIG